MGRFYGLRNLILEIFIHVLEAGHMFCRMIRQCIGRQQIKRRWSRLPISMQRQGSLRPKRGFWLRGANT
jgi:hypothetical protein